MKLKDKFLNNKPLKKNYLRTMVAKAVIGAVIVGTFSVTSKVAFAQDVVQTSVPYEYTVKSGDSLWIISNKFSVSISSIKSINNLTSDIIYVGQKLYLKPQIQYEYYIVKAGDTLWKISNLYGTTINNLKTMNNLSSDIINIGQSLKVREVQTTQTIQNTQTTSQATNLNAVYEWPSITYIVQAGDTAESIAKKFNTSAEAILKYNYMSSQDWFDEGDKIAISGYAPRTYTVFKGESPAPQRVGKLVDWFLEGQYILKRWDILTIVDVETGKQFNVKMIGGYNHSDVEPVTTADTQVMKELFGQWTWSPRAVVVFKDGMNIAASLSGMPHSVEWITDNGVTGHFDLYLKNSLPHGSGTSQEYINQHYNMVNKAAGK